MSSGRFLFVTWDGGGNTPPMYLLAQRLIGRGHQVTVLGQPPQATRVRQLGATFVPLALPEPSSTASDGERLRSLLFAPAVGEAVLKCIEREAPDALVVDCMLAAGLAAAESAQLPSAALVHVLYSTFALHGSRGPRTFGMLFEKALPMINQMRSGFSLPPVASTSDLLNRMQIALVSSPREFDLPLPDLPRNVRYVSAIRDYAPFTAEEAQWAWGTERPRIVVSFSTTHQHQEEALRRVTAALAALPVQVVVTTGDGIDPSIITPTSNITVRRYVPHAALFPGCALVVTHAGLGTVLAALTHGVPLLCMPMGSDQVDNATRVAACGAGLVLDPDATMEQIDHALRLLLATPSYTIAVRRLAAILARQDGATTAIGELERLLM